MRNRISHTLFPFVRPDMLQQSELRSTRQSVFSSGQSQFEVISGPRACLICTVTNEARLVRFARGGGMGIYK